jgi:hypothetical protein
MQIGALGVCAACRQSKYATKRWPIGPLLAPNSKMVAKGIGATSQGCNVSLSLKVDQTRHRIQKFNLTRVSKNPQVDVKQQRIQP